MKQYVQYIKWRYGINLRNKVIQDCKTGEYYKVNIFLFKIFKMFMKGESE